MPRTQKQTRRSQMSREKTQHALNSLLWAENRYLPDTITPRCRGRPLDPELYLSCVCNLFCRGFRCRAGIFSNGNIFLILAAKEQYNLQASSWGLGRGGKGGKRARKELFPCSLHSPTAWRLRKTRIMKIRFPSYLGIVFILPSKCYVLKERLRGQRIKRERLGTRLGLVHFVVLHSSGNAVLVQL